MIKQIIDESKTVQTELAVEVDGTRIYYRRLTNNFGYTFWAIIGFKENEETAIKEVDAAIDTVIATMCAQSYDHGSEWRLVRKEVDIHLLERYGQYQVTAYFKINDIY